MDRRRGRTPVTAALPLSLPNSGAAARTRGELCRAPPSYSASLLAQSPSLRREAAAAARSAAATAAAAAPSAPAAAAATAAEARSGVPSDAPIVVQPPAGCVTRTLVRKARGRRAASSGSDWASKAPSSPRDEERRSARRDAVLGSEAISDGTRAADAAEDASLDDSRTAASGAPPLEASATAVSTSSSVARSAGCQRTRSDAAASTARVRPAAERLDRASSATMTADARDSELSLSLSAAAAAAAAGETASGDSASSGACVSAARRRPYSARRKARA